MISPVAIIAALALWAPFTQDGLPPCWSGLTINYASRAQITAALGHPAVAFSYKSAGCVITVQRVGRYRWDLPTQCTLVAHEIGHAVFGLEHSDPRDLTNVMNGERFVIPRGCRIRPAGTRAKGARR